MLGVVTCNDYIKHYIKTILIVLVVNYQKKQYIVVPVIAVIPNTKLSNSALFPLKNVRTYLSLNEA